jgi:UDP-N-acetylmuramoyl-tripeptide--D-alanyl-D-alanine ligase
VNFLRPVFALIDYIGKIPKRGGRLLFAFHACSRRGRSATTLIAITGSSGKSTTARLLNHILAARGKTEAIIQHHFYSAIIRKVLSLKKHAEFAVCEVSAGGKGEIPRIARVLQPDVGIVTFVGLEHYSTFRSIRKIADEKAELIKAIRRGGFAILNADDELVVGMRECTAERIVTIGRQKPADYRVVDAVSRYPEPLTVEIVWSGGHARIKTGFFGEHFWLSVAAAFATAMELGLPQDLVISQCESFQQMADRLQPYPTLNGPVFLLDTIKAPFGTVGLPFEEVAKANVERRRIVVGQISDYAGSRNAKYRDTFRMGMKACDQVIFVGDHAHRSKASAQEIASGRFVALNTVREVSDHIRKTAKAGELILLKGSGSFHLERVALAWSHDVRCWSERCGIRGSCFECGLYEFPFEAHEAIRKKPVGKRGRFGIRSLLATFKTK